LRQRTALLGVAATLGVVLAGGCSPTTPPAPDTPTATAQNDYTQARNKIGQLRAAISRLDGDKAQLKEYLAQQACEVDRDVEDHGSSIYDTAVYDELVTQYNKRFHPEDPKSSNSSALTAQEAKYCGDLKRVKDPG
jgi:hypothetical protein